MAVVTDVRRLSGAVRSLVVNAQWVFWRMAAREVTAHHAGLRPAQRPCRPEDENEAPVCPRWPRSGPMEIWELYEWHRARGTLALFFFLFSSAL